MMRRPLLLLVLIALGAAHAEEKLRVHLDRVIQPEYLGVNAVYHAFAFMPEEEARGMDDADRAREFDRVSRMGLHIARTWYRPDWTFGGSLDYAPDWESPKMRALYRWLGEMQRRKVDVALQAGWWFTRDTYLGFDAPDPARNLDRYAAWVSDSLHEIIETRGFHNVKYLILFTEPTSYNSGAVPPGETQWSYHAKAVRAIDARLRADSRRALVKLVGPNNTGGGRFLKEAVAELNDAIDIYSGHDYKKAGYDEWLAVCRKMAEVVAPTRKPLWLDELGKQDEAFRATGAYGNYLAQIVAASINAGLQTSLQWLLFDQQYVAPLETMTNRDSFHNGVHRWGICKWPHDDIEDPSSCYPQWYAVSLMSKYLGGNPPAPAFETESGPALKLAATAPGGGLSLLVVNTSQAAQKFSIELTGGRERRTFRRHLYDPAAIKPDSEARILPAAGKFRGNFRDAIPAGAVALYTTLE